MDKQYINPPELAKLPGYTQVVTATGGKIVFVAGQVALNGKGELVGKGDLRAQTIQVFENLKTALAAVGATFADVLKTNLYVVNFNPDMLPIIREARSLFLPPDHPPASTLVGVQALALEGLLIEIEVVAMVKE